MERRQRHIAGGLLVIGTLWIIVAIRLAELLTPDYSIAGEAISGLGSTFFSTFPCVAAHCNVIYQPASSILILSEIFFGMLFLTAAYCISRAGGQRLISRPLALMGMGTLALSLSYLPLYIGGAEANFTLALILHIASSLFLVGVAAFLALRADAFVQPWLKYISRILGAIAIVSVPLYAYLAITNSLWGPGPGGVERIGFYVICVWLLGYGIYLILEE